MPHKSKEVLQSPWVFLTEPSMHRISKTQLSDNVFLLRFATQYELASTFLRFQEHFESSRFGGRIFSLEEFMDWYASTFGSFTYFQDWAGFNIPSTALDPFLAGRFDPLLEKEKRFLELFAGEPRPFYIIGVLESSSRPDIIHELAHALFFCDPAYKAAVVRALRRYDTSTLAKALERLGYRKSVLEDEVHAYLISGDGSLPSLSTNRLAPLRSELRTLFRRHGATLIDAVAHLRPKPSGRRARRSTKTPATK